MSSIDMFDSKIDDLTFEEWRDHRSYLLGSLEAQLLDLPGGEAAARRAVDTADCLIRATRARKGMQEVSNGAQ